MGTPSPSQPGSSWLHPPGFGNVVLVPSISCDRAQGGEKPHARHTPLSGQKLPKLGGVLQPHGKFAHFPAAAVGAKSLCHTEQGELCALHEFLIFVSYTPGWLDTAQGTQHLDFITLFFQNIFRCFLFVPGLCSHFLFFFLEETGHKTRRK